jgi:hypothetical protein
VLLHVTGLVLTCGCAIAAWWQVNRAEDGNQLSYFYSVMWPVFGILVVTFWWLLIHTDFDSAGIKGLRRHEAGENDCPEASDPGITTEPTIVAVAEDPEMAAYNARLASLAAAGPKTWRHRDPVVVRRSQ